MNLAEQLEILTSRGFSEERAETVVLMREAAIVLFEAFPDVLLLVGGASLILFQNSVRHSADLDFVPLVTDLPRVESLTGVLAEGLRPLAQLLDLAPLSFKTLNSGPDFSKGPKVTHSKPRASPDRQCENGLARSSAVAEGAGIPSSKNPQSSRRVRHSPVA
jgi:hypothetical protein